MFNTSHHVSKLCTPRYVLLYEYKNRLVMCHLTSTTHVTWLICDIHVSSIVNGLWTPKIRQKLNIIRLDREYIRLKALNEYNSKIQFSKLKMIYFSRKPRDVPIYGRKLNSSTLIDYNPIWELWMCMFRFLDM